jgi:hypothetical protein
MTFLKQFVVPALGLLFSCGLFTMALKAEALEYHVLATTLKRLCCWEQNQGWHVPAWHPPLPLKLWKGLQRFLEAK